MYTSRVSPLNFVVVLIRTDWLVSTSVGWSSLAAEAVQRASLAFQGVHDVHGRHRLALGVLRVGDRVADHVLEEHLENTTRLLVDEARDTLDTATAGQTTDGRFRDALDVVAKHFAMALGASLAETFTSFTTS